MLLISTTHRPATDLGYLLHKNPGRLHRAELSFGEAWVGFPEATEASCTAALMLRYDAVGMVRRGRDHGGSIAEYVNDRPYVASSFLSVAIADLFGTAMAGRSKERQELANAPMPLSVRIPVLVSRSGPERIVRLFGPLGYEVEATNLPLDPQFPDWGSSPYYDVTLHARIRLGELLRHLYVLLPVLDARKHYHMDPTEVDKLIVKGKGWLEDHPEKDWIVRSYLSGRRTLMREAMEQLANVEEDLVAEEAAADEATSAPEDEPPKERLHRVRHLHIIDRIRELKPASVLDLGCGSGELLRELVKIQGIDRIVGMDVRYFALEVASRRLRLEEAAPRYRDRIQLIHGSLMYRDRRLEGFDLATVVEVVEHLDPPRLAAFERVVFEFAQPACVILTTPNREYNPLYELEDRLRHEDHRFEWTRAEFQEWAHRIAHRYGYEVGFEGIGEVDPNFGPPSQMAVFRR